MRITGILSALLVLYGCATSPTPIAQARVTPQERIYQIGSEAKSAATVIFVRDTGFTGSGVYLHISINGEKAISLDVGEKGSIRLAPGEYVFGVLPTDAFGTHAETAIDQRLEPDRTYYYRLATDGDTLKTAIQRSIPK